jgi:hypothetical protein
VDDIDSEMRRFDDDWEEEKRSFRELLARDRAKIAEAQRKRLLDDRPYRSGVEDFERKVRRTAASFRADSAKLLGECIERVKSDADL